MAVTKSLEESLELYLKHGTLSGDNQYYCQYCGFRTDATRFIHIKKLPVYLNIQLLRFIYNPKTESLKKIKSNFKFPLIADFKQHVHSNSDCRYELYAILNHHGQNATSGHYIVDIKIDGKWSRFDDDSVSVLENVEGASSTAYILVYKLASMNYISDNEIPGVFVNEINEDNNLFKIQDDELQAKLKVDLELKNQVKEIVNLVVDLNSNIQDNDDCFLVSSESFKPWTALKILDKNHVFKNEKIECKHGNVDGNSKYMRVSTESYELLKNFGLDFDPVFDSKSICLECREFSDQGDLFYQKHSKFVNALKKAIDLDDDGLSFYISKAWYNGILD